MIDDPLKVINIFRNFFGLEERPFHRKTMKIDPDLQVILWKYYQLLLKTFTIRQLEGMTDDKERLQVSYDLTCNIINEEFACDLEKLINKRLAKL